MSLRSTVGVGVVGFLGCAVLAPVTVRAQAPGTVVLRAVDGEGRPVMDLKPADVSVRVDGRQREVTNLELVQPAARKPGGGASAHTPPLPAPYASNATAGGSAAREFLIAVDDDGIAPGRDSVVREAIDTLLSRLGPDDAVGVVSMRRGGPSLAPTTDHAAVRDTLGRMTATGSGSESTVDLGCRTKSVLAGMSSLLEGAPVTRTILLFSPGVTTPTGDQMRESLGRQQDADQAVCQVRQRDLDDLGRVAAASAAEVMIVFIPEAIANPAHLKTGEAGLENIAGTTDGEMIRMIGSAGAAMTRVAETAGIYYVATLEGSGGTARRVDARASRDGLRVSARPITAAPAAAGKATPREMIRVATAFTALPLRAAGFVSRQPGAKDHKVVALFEPQEPSAKLASAIVGLFDESGTLKAQWTAQPNELGRAPLVAALTAAPGRYRMRVAATDAAGQGGSVDYDLLVELPQAPPVTTSHMLLGVSQNGFSPRLAFTAADAAAIGFLEVYGVNKDAKIEALFEIVKPDGEVLGSGQGTVGAGPGDDARIVYGGFGIATLEPGDYTMRATLSVDGRQAGVARRTLRKLP